MLPVGRRHTRVAPGACLGADTLNVLTGTRFQRPWDVDRSDQLSASSSENVDHTSPPIPAVLTFRSEFEQVMCCSYLDVVGVACCARHHAVGRVF